MKPIPFLLILPLALAACSGWKQPTEELQAVKAQCVAQDYDACAEIGHYAREGFYHTATSVKPKGSDVLVPQPAAVQKTPAVVDGVPTGAEPIID